MPCDKTVPDASCGIVCITPGDVHDGATNPVLDVLGTTRRHSREVQPHARFVHQEHEQHPFCRQTHVNSSTQAPFTAQQTSRRGEKQQSKQQSVVSWTDAPTRHKNRTAYDQPPQKYLNSLVPWFFGLVEEEIEENTRKSETYPNILSR